MTASFNKFYGKIWDGFCFNTGKRFLVELLLKANRKRISSSKKQYYGFLNSSQVKVSTHFYVTIAVDLERFQYFDFEKKILKK